MLSDASSLVRVTRSTPCPICERPSWCGIQQDGKLAVCMRIEEGAVRSSANGGWVHVLRDDHHDLPIPGRNRAPRPSPRPSYTAVDAQRTWADALQRALDDARVVEDEAVYDYVDRRGLGEAWGLKLFGILAPDRHSALARWAGRGYRVVVPCHDLKGEIVSIQARAIGSSRPKTLFPSGCEKGEKLFANPRGRDMLRGTRPHSTTVLCEGLTDYCAVGAAVPHLPVLGVPGVTSAPSAMGPWVAGRTLILAFDNDEAGQRATQKTAALAYQNGAADIQTVDWGEAGDACELVERRGISALWDLLTEVAHD